MKTTNKNIYSSLTITVVNKKRIKLINIGKSKLVIVLQN